MARTFKGTVEQAGRNGAKTDVYMLVTNNFAHIFTKIHSTPLYENFDRFFVAQTAEYLHIYHSSDQEHEHEHEQI
jgi:hypothetical protein